MPTFSSYQPAYQNIKSKREREQRHTGRANVSSVNDSVRSRVCLLCLQETVTAVKGVTLGILYVFSPPPLYIKIYFLHFPSFQSCQHTYICKCFHFTPHTAAVSKHEVSLSFYSFLYSMFPGQYQVFCFFFSMN